MGHDYGNWGTIPLLPEKCPSSQRNRAPHRSGMLPHFKRNHCPTSTGIRNSSVISYWEVLLKSGKGKLDVGDPRQWWAESLEKLTATALPLRPEHISEIYHLEPIHHDPFDRVLIAQATTEQLSLVTTDRQIRNYASARLRVIA